MQLGSRFLGVIFFLSLFQSSYAAAASDCVPGTYLVQEDAGAQSLWTFSKDGTVQFASSAQGPLNFSDAHGAWKQTRRNIKATVLDFNYAGSPPPSAIARVDAELTFSKKCSTVEGSFQLRFFDPGTEDPLNPESDNGDPLSDSFTGRRVTVKE
jgi:hypothetical protein